VVLLDDAEHGGQPESGALAGGLGGEERLEDALAIGGGYAAAGVAYEEGA
jgi:hypothetical protein